MSRVETGEAVALHGARVVIGSIGDDIHVVGITILAHALRNAGAEVIQLGIQTPPEEFVATAVAEDADALFVSSSNGHAAFFCANLRADLDSAGATEIILYGGGNLEVSADAVWAQTEEKWREMGFDRVFAPRTQPAIALEALRRDLVAKGKSHRYA